MNYFIKANKNLLTYSLIALIVIPIFGIKFFISFLGNILLLLFLIHLSKSINNKVNEINYIDNYKEILYYEILYGELLQTYDFLNRNIHLIK